MTQFEIIIAGFGGQGVMSMGQLLAYAGMIEGKHVTWLPSYGPEQRGGTANVSVIISDSEIGSPVITRPTAAFVLNNPSFEKFEQRLTPGGTLIMNRSLIGQNISRQDIQVIDIPASDLATELGNPRVANTIMLGAYLSITKALTFESIVNSLRKVLPERKYNLININKKALEKGAEFLRK